MKTLFNTIGTLNESGNLVERRVLQALQDIMISVTKDGYPVHEVELVVARAAHLAASEKILTDLINTIS
jgi:hypothetical protein